MFPRSMQISRTTRAQLLGFQHRLSESFVFLSTTMTQLTSRIVQVIWRYEISTGNTLICSWHPRRVFSRSSPCSPPIHRSTTLFVSGCHLLSGPSSHPSRDATTVQLRSSTRRGADFNRVDRRTAVRFYCEYKTRERIHRSLADLRLLAIPAS